MSTAFHDAYDLRFIDCAGRRDDVGDEAEDLPRESAKHAVLMLARVTKEVQARRTGLAESSKKPGSAVPASGGDTTMKTIKRMTLLVIIALLASTGLMLGGCYASVGVDPANVHQHVHGENCGHTFDGTNWH